MAISPQPSPTGHVTTTVLINNLHCSSCLHYIQEVLSSIYQPAPLSTTADYVSQEVVVIHSPQLSAHEISRALLDAAFEVQRVQTKDEFGHVIYKRDAAKAPQEWSEDAAQILSKEASTLSRSNVLASTMSPSYSNYQPSMKHIEYCVACQKQDVKIEVSEGLVVIPEAQKFTATLSIAGMTCAACILAINEGVQELSSLESVSVSLLTNSATVIFAAPKSNIDEIVETIEDRGFGCEVEAITEAGGLQNEGEKEKRKIMIKIGGMSSPRCPHLILEGLSSAFPGLLDVEKQPSLEDPIIVLAYQPQRGIITIRDISATITGINNQFRVVIYHPPTIEERSQAMQLRERYRLLLRLLLSFFVAIPTFLIGVVWMSLVPSTNTIRNFFEENMWAGANTRTEWALFFLATPVMFFAADVFHLRAMKEIRALWSFKSRVPILRRFYRFGSMNLLMSAGSESTSAHYTFIR